MAKRRSPNQQADDKSVSNRRSRQEQAQPEPERDERVRQHYFQPNQVALRINHQESGANERLGDSQISAVANWLRDRTPSLLPGLRIDPNQIKYRTYSFGSKNGKPAFTMMFAEYPKDLVHPRQLVQLVDQLHNEATANVGQSKQQGGGRFAGATVEQVALNWFGSGAQQIGDGGPGGRPTPFLGHADSANYRIALPKNFEDELNNSSIPLEERGQGVTVAILDTAPSLHELAEAYYKWEIRDARNNPHPLIKTLLYPSGPLHVHPASRQTLHRLAGYHIQEHDYKLTSHGLFIAGIIHSMAPRAEIHLFEALNPYGVCDGESIIEALSLVDTELQQEPVLVNCSLYFVFPFEVDHYTKYLEGSVPFTLRTKRDWSQLLGTQNWAEQGKLTEPIFENFAPPAGAVIAAAGNDAIGGKRPGARYPAAFDLVTGVAALGSNRAKAAGNPAPASYSNIADRPARTGVTTFGGEEGEGNGILGVYLGELPAPYQNISDWAWWCGTSFATPIITGTLAALLTGGRITVENALTKVMPPVPLTGKPLTKMTKDDEPVFEASQPQP